MVDFLFAIIENFSIAVMVHTLYADIGWSRRFIEGMGQFKLKFRWNEIAPTNVCWYQQTRVITLSCGIKISAVCSLVSSQSTRVMDRRTDGRTDGRTDRQNYDPQNRASIAASRGKIIKITVVSTCENLLWLLVQRTFTNFYDFRQCGKIRNI